MVSSEIHYNCSTVMWETTAWRSSFTLNSRRNENKTSSLYPDNGKIDLSDFVIMEFDCISSLSGLVSIQSRDQVAC